MIQIAIQISNETERNKRHKGPFIYYVMTFLGFFDPSPPLCNHAFTTENNQKLAFSDPPPTLHVIT